MKYGDLVLKNAICVQLLATIMADFVHSGPRRPTREGFVSYHVFVARAPKLTWGSCSAMLCKNWSGVLGVFEQARNAT